VRPVGIVGGESLVCVGESTNHGFFQSAGGFGGVGLMVWVYGSNRGDGIGWKSWCRGSVCGGGVGLASGGGGTGGNTTSESAGDTAGGGEAGAGARGIRSSGGTGIFSSKNAWLAFSIPLRRRCRCRGQWGVIGIRDRATAWLCAGAGRGSRGWRRIGIGAWLGVGATSGRVDWTEPSSVGSAE